MQDANAREERVRPKTSLPPVPAELPTGADLRLVSTAASWTTRPQVVGTAAPTKLPPQLVTAEGSTGAAPSQEGNTVSPWRIARRADFSSLRNVQSRNSHTRQRSRTPP